MYRQYKKLDPLQVQSLKQKGLSNRIIAQRLGVTQGAIYHVLRRLYVKNYSGEFPVSSKNCWRSQPTKFGVGLSENGLLRHQARVMQKGLQYNARREGTWSFRTTVGSAGLYRKISQCAGWEIYLGNHGHPAEHAIPWALPIVIARKGQDDLRGCWKTHRHPGMG